jgi:hypothetical protein
MPWYEDAADRLLVAQAVTTVPVIQESRFAAWDLCTDLVVQLLVSAAAAGAGDTLSTDSSKRRSSILSSCSS